MAFQASQLKNQLSLPLTSNGAQQAVAQYDYEILSDYTLASGSAKLGEIEERLKSTGEIIELDKTSQNAEVIEVTNETRQSVGATTYPEPTDNMTMQYKVTLSEEPMLDLPIVFNVMPSISESRSASYDAVQPLHHPGEILKYKATSARSWNIDTKLISRNSGEASINHATINRIRSWVMPFYGQGTANDPAVSKYLGAPPPILTLTAYGEQMIGPVKVVLESYDWQWPNDVDYIPTLAGVPFPVIVSIRLTLKESWSPAEYSGFNLREYRMGYMNNAFTAVRANESKQNTNEPVIVPATGAGTAKQAKSEPVVLKPTVSFGPPTGQVTQMGDNAGEYDNSVFGGGGNGFAI